LENSVRVSELALDRWDEELSDELDQEQVGIEAFRLSGAVFGPATKTSNRIDDLLTRMLRHPGLGKYLGNVDKNLDYLYTCLQLDLIGRVAEDVAEKEKEDAQKIPPVRDSPDMVDIPEQVDEDSPGSFISLDRSRSSV
jgi:hypothetical protein